MFSGPSGGSNGETGMTLVPQRESARWASILARLGPPDEHILCGQAPAVPYTYLSHYVGAILIPPAHRGAAVGYQFLPSIAVDISDL